jgi:hypothetical protein
MRLVNDLGEEIAKGSKVYDKDGNEHIVSYCAPPHSAASSGKMSVEGGFTEYYVSCYNCEWVEREDREPVADLSWKPVDNEVKKGIQHRLMELLIEIGYKPTLDYGSSPKWMITFKYDEDIGKDRTWIIRPSDRISNQWWLV